MLLSRLELWVKGAGFEYVVSLGWVDNSVLFMKVDGKWRSSGSPQVCREQRLCTVCSFASTPTLLLKGLCSSTNFDRVYYGKIQANGTIHFEGYIRTKISKSNDTWVVWNPKEYEGDSTSMILKVGHQIKNIQFHCDCFLLLHKTGNNTSIFKTGFGK